MPATPLPPLHNKRLDRAARLRYVFHPTGQKTPVIQGENSEIQG
jgi:hypothetical protein